MVTKGNYALALQVSPGSLISRAELYSGLMVRDHTTLLKG